METKPEPTPESTPEPTLQGPPQPITEIDELPVRAAAAEKGFTLLEIMIVLAILALVMGLLIGPKIMSGLTAATEKTQKMTVDMFANQAYPRWRLDNPGKKCPSNLSDLMKYMNKVDGMDSYTMYCGSNAPKEATGGFGVAHAGDDGKSGTADDIKSWAAIPKKQ